MERKIIIHREVWLFLQKLAGVLFAKEYFGFFEDSMQYVDRLVGFIYQYVGILQGKDAPSYFRRYGKNLQYIAYRANKATSWYICYRQHENRFAVCYITNNHVAGKYFDRIFK